MSFRIDEVEELDRQRACRGRPHLVAGMEPGILPRPGHEHLRIRREELEIGHVDELGLVFEQIFDQDRFFAEWPHVGFVVEPDFSEIGRAWCRERGCQYW